MEGVLGLFLVAFKTLHHFCGIKALYLLGLIPKLDHPSISTGISVAYPGWHTPGVQTEDGVLAPPGKLKNGAPRLRCWIGEGGSMLEVIISFSDNVIGIRLLKIALTLN